MTSINAANDIHALYLQLEELEQKAKAEPVTISSANAMKPNEPLPGSSVSEAELLRIVRESFQAVALSMSGSAEEAIQAKKSMISAVKDGREKLIEERTKQLEQLAKADKNKSIWGKIGKALTFVAAIVIAPFNPVMAAVMVATMVASMVIPKVVDKILEAAGVSDAVRRWVKVGIEIAIAVVGMVASFNPRKIVSKAAAKAGKAVAKMTEKAAVTLKKGMDTLKRFETFNSLSSRAGTIITKAMNKLQPLLDKIQNIGKNSELVTSRLSQVSSASNGVSSMVESGYSIHSASLTKSTTILKAQEEELASRTQQLMKIIDDTIKILNHAFEALITVMNHERDYMKNSINAIKA